MRDIMKCPYCIDTFEWLPAERLHALPLLARRKFQAIIKPTNIKIHTRRWYTSKSENYVKCMEDK